MLRARVCALLGFGLMLAAASAEARELDFSVDSTVGWDGNVFKRERDVQRDGYWEFSPRVVVRDTQDTLEYSFAYRPTFQAFFGLDNIDGWDQSGSGDFAWRISPASTLTIGGGMVSSRTVSQFTDQRPGFSPADPDLFILVDTDRERVNRANARIGFSRSLGPGFSSQIDYSFDDFDFRRNTNVDSRSHSISGGINRVVDSRTQAGLSASFRLREGRALDTGPDTQFAVQTQTVELSFVFIRALSPTTDFSLRIGPSFISSEQNAPPGLSVDQPILPRHRTKVEDDTSFVADVSVSKRMQKSELSLNYSRFQSGSGGTSSASIVDQVTSSITHRPIRSVRLKLSMAWYRRDVISAVGRTGDRTTSQYSVSGSASYAVSRNLTVIARSSYRYVVEDLITVSGFGATAHDNFETHNYVGSLTLRYTFDPVLF